MKSICGSCNRVIKFGSTCSCKQVQKRKYKKLYEEKNSELTKLLKSARWRKFRKHIIKRDGFSCQRCLIKYNIVETENLQVHHIKPRSKYPELMFEKENCVALCRPCNTHIGTDEELDFEFIINEGRNFVL